MIPIREDPARRARVDYGQEINPSMRQNFKGFLAYHMILTGVYLPSQTQSQELNFVS